MKALPPVAQIKFTAKCNQICNLVLKSELAGATSCFQLFNLNLAAATEDNK